MILGIKRDLLVFFTGFCLLFVVPIQVYAVCNEEVLEDLTQDIADLEKKLEREESKLETLKTYEKNKNIWRAEREIEELYKDTQSLRMGGTTQLTLDLLDERETQLEGTNIRETPAYLRASVALQQSGRRDAGTQLKLVEQELREDLRMELYSVRLQRITIITRERVQVVRGELEELENDLVIRSRECELEREERRIGERIEEQEQQEEPMLTTAQLSSIQVEGRNIEDIKLILIQLIYNLLNELEE